VTLVLSALIGTAGATVPPSGRTTLQQGMVDAGYPAKPECLKQSFLDIRGAAVSLR
jgi:hypothetical protein